MTDSIDSVFRLLDREVWIVTASTEGKRGGLTATFVSRASIDSATPTVVVGIAANHYTRDLIEGSGGFALHLLAPDQIEIAWNFAHDSGRDRDKLSALATVTAKSGSPRLNDCRAWLDCRVLARLNAGDRLYFWADVLDGAVESVGEVLREKSLFAGLNEKQRALLAAQQHADAELQRPLRNSWRTMLPDLLQLTNRRT